MKWLFYSLIFFLTSSCIDFDRSEHIEEIDSSIEELKQSTVDLNDPILDSIPIVLAEIKRVKSKIRSFIKQDTFSLETALKIDEYKRVENELYQIIEQTPVIKKDMKSVISDLRDLKKDISNNSGDRTNYITNLTLEKGNQKVLIKAVERYIYTCRSSFETFHSIHNALDDYSNQLEMKNKDQNLIP